MSAAPSDSTLDSDIRHDSAAARDQPPASASVSAVPRDNGTAAADPAHRHVIPPPPEERYTTPEETEKAIHEWSKAHGYEIVRQCQERNAKQQVYKRHYACSRHGKLRNTSKLTPETRRRQKTSRRIGCRMKLVISAVDPQDPSGPWVVRHKQDRGSELHNHEPEPDAAKHTGHRKRAREEVKTTVEHLLQVGVTPSQAYAFLEKQTGANGAETLISKKDFYNMIAPQRREQGHRGRGTWKRDKTDSEPSPFHDQSPQSASTPAQPAPRQDRPDPAFAQQLQSYAPPPQHSPSPYFTQPRSNHPPHTMPHSLQAAGPLTREETMAQQFPQYHPPPQHTQQPLLPYTNGNFGGHYYPPAGYHMPR